MPQDPYTASLAMLARRELSAAQIHQRLARRGYTPDAIDSAIERLKSEGSLDDERVAAVIARNEANTRGRGRLRVKQRIEAAGIESAIAQRAVDEVFAALDEDALLAGALAKRLRGRTVVTGDVEFGRLYRYLVGQGFDGHRVLALLRKHSGPADDLQ